MKILPLCIGVLMSAAVLHSAAPSAPQSFVRNIAYGKPYTFSQTPNFRSDPGGALTDGIYTTGRPLWSQAGSVGWNYINDVSITIDLGDQMPVGGVAINTAGGGSSISWPFAVLMLFSDDASTWRYAGDLLALAGRGATQHPTDYAVIRFRADGLNTACRYVQVLILSGNGGIFLDEIEVYSPSPDTGEVPLASLPLVADITTWQPLEVVDAAVRRRLRYDLFELEDAVDASGLGSGDKATLLSQIDAIASIIPTNSVRDVTWENTIFPVNNTHTDIFKIQAAFWAALSLDDVILWGSDPWDMLDPITTPSGAADVEIKMMNKERRSGCFNISNSTQADTNLFLIVTNLPSGTNPDYVQLYQVPFTDTRTGVAVASALVPLSESDGRYGLTVASGMTSQIWIMANPTNLTAGDNVGSILVADSDSGLVGTVPITITTFDVEFPDSMFLHCGGWDYTDSTARKYVTPENKVQAIAVMREYGVNAPWARGDVQYPATGSMKTGSYNAFGTMTTPPDSTQFQEWVEAWPSVGGYYVYLNVAEPFAGLTFQSAAWEAAITQWINWWVAKLDEWDIGPESLYLYLIDEPKSIAEDNMVIAYGNAIKAAQPDVVIWQTSGWRPPTNGSADMYAISDELCPHLPWFTGTYASFYVDQGTAGKDLSFYSALNRARVYDPFTYYRLPAWYCWEYEGRGVHFWAFMDHGVASSWNEYSAGYNGGYTPLFVDAVSVTGSKHMAAIQEGLQDYEYLLLLQTEIDRFEPEDDREDIVAARTLMAETPDQVLSGARLSGAILWTNPKNRNAADNARADIIASVLALRALE